MRALSIVATLPFCWAKTGLDQPFTSSYAKLDHAACYSLFHRKGRAGCGTESHNAQVGQLKYFDGSLPDTDEPYVAVIEEEMLTAQTFETLLGVRGGLLKGVLVLNATSEEDGDKSSTFYSPDGQFPRGYGTPSESLNYGYYKYAWNPKGQGLLDYDMHGIPLAYVIDSDVATSLRQESMSEGVGGSIVAEFNYYMGPENMNSINCLQWKDEASKEWNPKCLPLGGTSVWASAGSPPNPNKNNNGNGNKSNQRPVVILAAGMDSTSLFHDLTPGANTAASNILTVLMAARMIGKLSDNTLDNLPNRIVFALFEGETYGFMGSRSFLRDVYYPGFKCYSNIVYSVPRLGEKSGRACLNPLRPSLQFSQIGQIKGMISVDQIGRVLGDGVLYVHADKNKDQYGSFIANVLKYSYTSYYKVASATEQNNNYGYAYPPSPLTSLLQLSQGAIGGAVLTGYDYAFTNKVPYHSHRDSASLNQMNLQSIAAAATIVARGALAAAYDDGNNDYQNAANYAMEQISELDANDELLTELSNCLLYDGECDLIRKYSQTEVANERIRTGANFGNPNSLGTPPNYYVGVYNRLYGQPFVLVGDQYYGAYSGNDFGNKNSDAIYQLPEALEMAIHGMFNDFLGRGSNKNNDFQSCKTDAHCGNVDYCNSYGDRPTCTASEVCVCKRAHYHVAVDEALVPADDKPPGYFVLSDNDQGVTPLYTEPYWSSSVGVRVYRDVGWIPGVLTLAAGFCVGAVSVFAAFVLRVGLKKEKLY